MLKNVRICRRWIASGKNKIFFHRFLYRSLQFFSAIIIYNTNRITYPICKINFCSNLFEFQFQFVWYVVAYNCRSKIDGGLFIL